jgi:hypothetical protein
MPGGKAGKDVWPLLVCASFRYVPYVECAIKGSSEMAPVCKAAGTKLFPSWQFGVEPPKEGVLSLDQLSGKTGCKLP